ncbi:MAG: (2Fe-2S) ferredoxin domain-containing protein, partial [Nitrospirota bacterium]
MSFPPPITKFEGRLQRESRKKQIKHWIPPYQVRGRLRQARNDRFDFKEMKKLDSIGKLSELREALSKETFKPDTLRARVCCGTACTATGSYKVIDAFQQESSKSGVELEIVKTGCQGLCQKGPVLRIEPADIFYQRTKPVNVPWIMSYSILGNMPYRQGLYRD